MKLSTKKSITVAKLTLMVLSICLLSSCSEEYEAKEYVRPVKMITVDSARLSRDYHYPGRVKASQEAFLSFVVAGRVVKLPVLRGQMLKKGALVAQLDQRDFVANLKSAKADYTLAQSQHKSFKKLLDQGVISQDEYNQKKKNIDVTLAEVRTAEKALEDSTLVAPFDGQVAERFVENHQDVQANQRIVYFQDITYLDILINVPESDVAGARGNKTVEELAKEITADVTFAAITGRVFKVNLKEFSAVADKETQTYLISFTMTRPTDVNIMPGMTATITLNPTSLPGEKDAAISVPISAVFADPNGTPHVWVVDPANMTVQKREVKIGEMKGGSIDIISGLKLGERIVTAGIKSLSEGTKVRKYEKFF